MTIVHRYKILKVENSHCDQATMEHHVFSAVASYIHMVQESLQKTRYRQKWSKVDSSQCRGP